MYLIRKIMVDCSITMDDLGQMTGYCKSAVYRFFREKYGTRQTDEIIRADIEKSVESSRCMMSALKEYGYKNVSDIWTDIPDMDGIKRTPGKKQIKQGLKPGDPTKVKSHKESIMITQLALKHFKMFRNPFLNDITDIRDIYMSEEHRFLKEMMLDAARYAGFVAVYGEVGCGKSVMRKLVVHELLNEGIKIIYPVIIDKTRISPSSLIDAIIMDISDAKPMIALEKKTRQALTFLRNRAASGLKQVLIIEEAHLLNRSAMKALKQIYELEEGFSKLVGIILIGQPELQLLLDETQNHMIREVIRRITQAEVTGLGSEVSLYIKHKFGRHNAKPETVFDPDAYDALEKRLAGFRGKSKKSYCYPLSVNNIVAKAMNMAAQMGEDKVTAEIILNC